MERGKQNEPEYVNSFVFSKTCAGIINIQTE